MIVFLYGGKVFKQGQFVQTDVLIANGRIEKIGSINGESLARFGFEVKAVDCTGRFILPGIIDSHMHLCGGSGERGGFATQTPTVLATECLKGGTTTVVGTLGVDTTTKTMRELVSRAKAYNEIGLNAFCYTGGYDTPTKTLLKCVRDDIIFVEEIIGVGEIAIADHRAPEPSLQDFARAVVDAHVAGMLANKAGVAHIHAGGGRRRLQLIRDLFEHHEIIPESIYVTHVERSRALVEEGVELAQRGCFIDFDVHDRDFYQWYKVYRELDGPSQQLTISSDAGILPPYELWEEIKNCVQQHKIPLEEILPYVTTNPARALKFRTKGQIENGFDADVFVANQSDLEIQYVIARGEVLFEKGDYNFSKRQDATRRGFDLYGFIS